MQEFLSFEDFTNGKQFCAVSVCCITGKRTLICYDQFLLGHCQKKLIKYLLNNYSDPLSNKELDNNVLIDNDKFKIKWHKNEFKLYSRIYKHEAEEIIKTEVFKIIIAKPNDLYW